MTEHERTTAAAEQAAAERESGERLDRDAAAEPAAGDAAAQPPTGEPAGQPPTGDPAATPEDAAAERGAPEPSPGGAAGEPPSEGAAAEVPDEEPPPVGETASEPAPAADDGRPAPAATAPQPAPPAEPDFQDRYLRTAAELENVRKRARRDVAAAESRGIARLAKELLPALDNFERALAAAESMPENADHHLTDGIRLVQAELLAALARVGIEPDSPRGERFDPHRHEAVAQQPVDGAESGTIVEVFQSGYRFGEELLRPAKVVVAA